MDAQSRIAETPNTDAPASYYPSVLSSLIDAAKRFASGCGQSLAQGADAMLDLGKRLCAIKEELPHGEFLSVVGERLRLNSSTANRMMVAARCFREGTPRRALTVLGKGRLYELTRCNEDELDALANGGTLHGCALSEIHAMPVKRLREWLRERDAQELKSILAKKGSRLDEPATHGPSRVIYLDENHDPDFNLPLQPGDRIRSLYAKRPGSVVRVYHDGSACILWDDGEPQAEGLGHERIPRELLELVKRPDPGAARARRKDYCRELCKVIARYSDDAEVTELTRALEGVSANILARRYCPGLNAASYDVFARLGMKGGVQ